MDTKRYTTVGEVMTMLKDYRPDEELMYVNSETRKVGHIMGIDEELSRTKGALVLRLVSDETYHDLKKVEDRVEMEKRMLDEVMDDIDIRRFKATVAEIKKTSSIDDMSLEDLAREIKKDPKKFKMDGREKKSGAGKEFDYGEWRKTHDTHGNYVRRDPIELLLEGKIPTGGRKGRPRKITNLPDALQKLLTRDRLMDMSPDELTDLMLKINLEMDRQFRHGK